MKERLVGEMNAAAENLEFERAARYRDRLAALSAVQATQGINTQGVEEADVFALDEQAGQFCVEVFFFRNWQNWGNRAYFPKAHKSMPPGEVLASFLAQFYDDKPAPRLILRLARDRGCRASRRGAVDAGRGAGRDPRRRSAASGATSSTTRCATPRRRSARRLADTASQQKLLTSLGQAFGLAKPPRRIDVFDNSHIMGTNAVGAMIVAGPAGLMKQHYRTFNIKSEELTPGDDYGMMREVLRRRFSRLVKEAPRRKTLSRSAGRGEFTSAGRDRSIPLPLAGRGRGGGRWAGPGPHRTRRPMPCSARERGTTTPTPSRPGPTSCSSTAARGSSRRRGRRSPRSASTASPLVGIAKGRDRDAGRETFFLPGKPPLKLPPRDPALYFVQRLRDEAHRFAIGAHRAKRKREMAKGPLDEIPGIGPNRKRALLHHFGTVKAIQRASYEDLVKTPGVNAATARAVYDFFHAGRG